MCIIYINRLSESPQKAPYNPKRKFKKYLNFYHLQTFEISNKRSFLAYPVFVG
jgi:hypothetical protein